MKLIQEMLQTPVRDRCDVLVAGGGVAGIAAALAAARGGASVILLEHEYILGGLGTAGLVTIYLPLCDGEGRQVSFGIAEELLRLSIRHGAEIAPDKAWLNPEGTQEERRKSRFQTQYNPQLFALLAERLLIENGVRILYGTTAVATVKEDKRITAVTVENKSGRYAIQVKNCVIDCTGDADICHQAGAETALFKRKNKLAAWHYSVSERDGYRLHQLGACDLPGGTDDNNPMATLTDTRYTGIDGDENSDAVAASHAFILNSVLREKERDASYIPVTIPTIPQFRMTRRIVGHYTLDDSEMHKAFPDSVGLFSDWRKSGPVYELPLTTLYGGDVDNLLCAGRCISVTDDMWDISRVIPVCAVSGQAAGTAAAMTDCLPRLSLTELQEKLKAAGVRLHE